MRVKRRKKGRDTKPGGSVRESESATQRLVQQIARSTGRERRRERARMRTCVHAILFVEGRRERERERVGRRLEQMTSDLE